MKAIVNDLGIFQKNGQIWLVCDGDWRDDFIDKTSSPKELQWRIEMWELRVKTYNQKVYPNSAGNTFYYVNRDGLA